MCKLIEVELISLPYISLVSFYNNQLCFIKGSYLVFRPENFNLKSNNSCQISGAKSSIWCFKTVFKYLSNFPPLKRRIQKSSGPNFPQAEVKTFWIKSSHWRNITAASRPKTIWTQTQHLEKSHQNDKHAASAGVSVPVSEEQLGLIAAEPTRGPDWFPGILMIPHDGGFYQLIYKG